jgi:hypothetical protein
LFAIASCTSSDLTASFAGTWKLAAGSTSDTNCVYLQNQNLSGTSVTLNVGTTVNLESPIGNDWPPATCIQLLDLTGADHTASIVGGKCVELDGMSGGGTWQVTIDPYSMTLELDDAEAKLTISGTQTISNLHNSGGSCTATLTATATRS